MLRTSTSLTKVDLSYNGFGELAGRAFGDVLANNSELRDLSLKWNSLRALGCAALTELDLASCTRVSRERGGVVCVRLSGMKNAQIADPRLSKKKRRLSLS